MVFVYGVSVWCCMHFPVHLSGAHALAHTYPANTPPPLPPQFIGNVAAQYAGACIGALCTKGVFFDSNGTGLAANQVNATFTNQQALLGEIMMTCLLCLTVLQTACEPRSIAKNMVWVVVGWNYGVYTMVCILTKVYNGFIHHTSPCTIYFPPHTHTQPPIQAPMAIGTAVFLGHTVLLNVDGCSINPARSFGSAAVGNYFRNFWYVRMV